MPHTHKLYHAAFRQQDGGMSTPCARVKHRVWVSFLLVTAWCRAAEAPLAGPAQADVPAPAFRIYSGNTHAHTSNTWSHGDHFIKAAREAGEEKEPGLTVSPEGVQSPPKGKVVKPDWQKHQGAPAQHYVIAKTNGYDFYAVTDHSQDFIFHPVSPTNTAWLAN